MKSCGPAQKSDKMAETHIAHAVSTFSELGIATGLVWLSDVIKIRSNLEADLLIAEESLRVTTEDYHAKADGFDGAIRSGIRIWMFVRKFFYTKIISLLLGLLRWSPYLCIGFGVFALFGIAFYPTAPNFFPSFFFYRREVLDVIYFWVALLSFMAIGIPGIPIVTQMNTGTAISSRMAMLVAELCYLWLRIERGNNSGHSMIVFIVERL